MQDFKGKMFEVPIPPFSLDIPDNEKNLTKLWIILNPLCL